MFELLKILIFTTLLGTSLANGCGDWVAYKDEKCFKVFHHFEEDLNADEVCRKNTNESILALIKTSEEQQFIEEYLKKLKVANNVWIGIKKMDETEIEFNNWAKGRPHKHSDDSNCVELSVAQINYGKWMDSRCEKKNAVLCEKIHPWSARLKSILYETRREFNDKIEQLTNMINEVPFGYIYLQLPGQSEPKTLWPNTLWENISAKYSGLFFRTEGGQSSPFGQIQEQQTQSLEFQNDIYNDAMHYSNWRKITQTPLKYCIFTGEVRGNNEKYYGMNLKHNNEEIRPRNQAIRIWQRIKPTFKEMIESTIKPKASIN